VLTESLLVRGFQVRSSRSKRTPKTRMPHEGLPAFRSAPAIGGIDSATRKFAPLPSAIGPSRCHFRCCASQEKARCRADAGLAGLPRRHNHGRLTRNRAMTRTSAPPLQSRNSINQCEGLLRVVTIGPRELYHQWNSTTVANYMTLAAKLRAVGGVRTCLKPPKIARTELPSTTARDQSICP